MLDPEHQHSLVTRLNRVEGQVRGIRKMIQEPRRCIEILEQLAAAEAALNRVGFAVFRFHVQTCVPAEITRGEPTGTQDLAELVQFFDRFSR
jgi:CsoR family transcriptional regulator, copper-sensing transcriptional repressor